MCTDTRSIRSYNVCQNLKETTWNLSVAQQWFQLLLTFLILEVVNHELTAGQAQPGNRNILVLREYISKRISSDSSPEWVQRILSFQIQLVLFSNLAQSEYLRYAE